MNKKCTNLQLFCPKFERTFMVKVDQNNIHFLFGEKNIIKSMCHYNISSTEWSQPLEIVLLTIICWVPTYISYLIEIIFYYMKNISISAGCNEWSYIRSRKR